MEEFNTKFDESWTTTGDAASKVGESMGGEEVRWDCKLFLWFIFFLHAGIAGLGDLLDRY